MDKSITIVQVADYYPPHLGGLERVAQEIAEQLARNGHTVTVLTSNVEAEKLPPLEVRDNLTIKRLWSFYFAHTAFIPGLFWQLMRVKKPAIFHVHLAQAYVPETVWLVSRLRDIPYVAHFHGDVEPSGPFGPFFILWKRWIFPVIIKNAAQIITLSDDQTKLIHNRYKKPEDQIRVISNGVGEQFLKIGENRRTIHKPLRLLFVGRLAFQKKPERLVEALPLIKSDVTLNMVGEGEDRQKLERLIADLKLTNITLSGRLDGEPLLDAYRNADVFVLPSDWEGMPLVLLEAMGTGLPIIGSDVLGIHELIDGIGILVKDPNPKNFAEAIDELAKNTEKLENLSIASSEKAKQYSWPKLTREIEELYDKVLK